MIKIDDQGLQAGDADPLAQAREEVFEDVIGAARTDCDRFQW